MTVNSNPNCLLTMLAVTRAHTKLLCCVQTTQLFLANQPLLGERVTFAVPCLT